MKARFIAALLCVVIPSSFALAQEESQSYTSGVKLGGLFQFSGLSDLGVRSFVPQGIGAKLYLNSVMAIRANVAFATNSLSLPYTGTGSGVDGSASATMFGAGGALEFHLSSKRLSPYIGAGINFSVNSLTMTTPADKAKNQVEYDNIPFSELAALTGTDAVDGAADAAANVKTYGTPGVTFGVLGIAGVEYFITKSISLGAEYNFGWSMTSIADQKVIPSGDAETTTIPQGTLNNFGFGLFNAGSLTLGLYF